MACANAAVLVTRSSWSSTRAPRSPAWFTWFWRSSRCACTSPPAVQRRGAAPPLNAARTPPARRSRSMTRLGMGFSSVRASPQALTSSAPARDSRRQTRPSCPCRPSSPVRCSTLRAKAASRSTRSSESDSEPGLRAS
ncbi:MAG TPA: hypothetical protein VFQ45_01825 [Longimicrobium sp.]|nr:hypothetical protein [Longimicrobium sp.]